MSPKYKLSKYVIFRDHTGKEQTLLQGQIFTWNQHRFVTADHDLAVIEISRAKLRAAGAKMIPCDSAGKELDLSPTGPDIVMPEPMVPEKKAAFSL